MLLVQTLEFGSKDVLLGEDCLNLSVKAIGTNGTPQ